MRDRRQALPKGWQLRMIVITAAALAGNLLMGIIPWPESSLAAFEADMSPAAAQGIGFWAVTLVWAPLLEEAVFRYVLYGRLRSVAGIWLSTFISSLAFGIYHGNWIQGSYAFLLGMILAWGYETSEYHKYMMAVLMHGTANMAALAVFGLQMSGFR